MTEDQIAAAMQALARAEGHRGKLPGLERRAQANAERRQPPVDALRWQRRRKALDLRNAGLGISAIARRIGVTPGCVYADLDAARLRPDLLPDAEG